MDSVNLQKEKESSRRKEISSEHSAVDHVPVPDRAGAAHCSVLDAR